MVPYQLSVRVLASLARVFWGDVFSRQNLVFCKTSESRFAKRGTLLREVSFVTVYSPYDNFSQSLQAYIQNDFDTIKDFQKEIQIGLGA
jgi:hypothetical protein